MSGPPSSSEYHHVFVLPTGGIDEARAAQDEVLAELESRAFDESCRFAVRLALEEALSNAFRHGNRNDPTTTVRFECRVGPDHVEFEIQDEGPGFDPGTVPDPTLEENLELPSGRGIMLMRSFMSEVRYEPPGNRVRMVFRRQA